MSITSVQATVDGTTHELTYNAESGKWEAPATAPTLDGSRSWNCYPVTLTATSDSGESTTLEATNSTLGARLRLVVIKSTATTASVKAQSNQGFLLDANGDVVIENGDIQMIGGDDLLRQTVQQVIGTNNGEWFLNEDEGINFRTLLTKSPDSGEVRGEIAQALMQVDETFVVQEFTMRTVDRNLRISFTAVNDSGDEIGGEYEYGA